MSLVILDMGSGNGHGNEIAYQKDAIDTVARIDNHKPCHRIVLKWQLEQKPGGNNAPLKADTFEAAYVYGHERGYECTSSVYDIPSYQDLIRIVSHHPSAEKAWGVPFIKIACQSEANPNVYDMVSVIPRGIGLYISIDPRKQYDLFRENNLFLWCIPEYPARLSDYPPGSIAYSDHTPGLDLWNYYHPAVWEKHFVLERDASNPDAGPFAITPEELKEVIG